MNKIKLVTFILTFWIIVYSLFVMVGESISAPTELGNAMSQGQSINGLTFMFQVMFFSVPASYEVPMIVSLILLLVFIMSVLAIVGILFGKVIDVQ